MTFLWAILFRVLSPLQMLFGGLALPSGLTLVAGLALAIIPAAATWHFMSVELATLKLEERRACDLKIQSIKDALLIDQKKKIAAAKEAAADVRDPKTDAELREICKRSASCRSRGDIK